MNEIAAYYDQLADQYGHSPQAVDASSQRALDVRYEVLGDVCDMNEKRVLDVGCGYGGLGAYLAGRYPQIRYVGIDISNRLLDIGRSHYPGLDLRHGDLADTHDRYDVVLAQGIFYKLDAPDEYAWRAAKTLISRLYWFAEEAAAFTAITTSSRGEYGLPAAETFWYCTERVTPYVTLRHDYQPGDICVYLHRHRKEP